MYGLVFKNVKNLNCIGTLFFHDSKRSIGGVFLIQKNSSGSETEIPNILKNSSGLTAEQI